MPKHKTDDTELLRRLEKHHPEVLEARIDFDAITGEIVRADAARIGVALKHPAKPKLGPADK